MNQSTKSIYNSNGVLIGRNFDYNWASTSAPKGSAAFSEVESQYIRDITTRHPNIKLAIDLGGARSDISTYDLNNYVAFLVNTGKNYNLVNNLINKLSATLSVAPTNNFGEPVTTSTAARYFYHVKNIMSVLTYTGKWKFDTDSGNSDIKVYNNIEMAKYVEFMVNLLWDHIKLFDSMGGLIGSETYDPGSVAAGAQVTTTITVTGAALGDYAMASFSVDVAGMTLHANVTSANTVTVTFQNTTASPIDLNSGTLRVKVIKA
jgi:hypothetical protein